MELNLIVKSATSKDVIYTFDYSDFTLANNDSVTTSGLTNYNEVLSEPYWASINSDSTIHEGLFFNEKRVALMDT
ncbi:MAG: hypothetical protein CM15mP106_7540 [Candidatus Neomarinimicrobiota bacterium]|nr:MAG: hypothetical protein CM15mP106_7540 [Candidatus Neomarinimicrobiota bacterium]